MRQSKEHHINAPVIVLAGNSDWIDPIQRQTGNDYRVLPVNRRKGYVNTLIDSLAIMILVDGKDPRWDYWITAAKSNSATRRIPIVLISDDAEQQAESAIKGADMAITTTEFLKTARKLVKDIARAPHPEIMKRLDCECRQELPPLAREGLRQFNAGEYYRQHDLFEEQWVKTEGPVRDLYRAILQVGVAYYQIQRQNYRGALKMLQRSAQWLAILPDICQGVDVRQLREDSYRARAELQRLGEKDFNKFDLNLIKSVKMAEGD